MAKSIKKNLLYNIILNVTNILFPIITAPYVARVLEPDGIGLFHFSYTVSGYFALAACLGIPTYGIRIVGANRTDFDKRQIVFNQVFTISFISTLFFTIGYLLSILFVSKFNESYLLFLISGVALYVVPFKVDWYFSGMGEFGYIAARSTIIKILSIALLFIFVKEKGDLVYYVSLSAFSIAANEIWNFIKLVKTGIRPKLVTSGLRTHIKPIFVLFSSFVATAIYTSLGSVLLGFMSNYSEVGFYNTASQIGRIAIPIVTSLALVALPKISEYMARNDEKSVNELINKSMSFVAFLSFPISMIICLISPLFIPLFFGPGYEAATVPMRILAFVVVAVGLNNLTGIQILIGLGKDRYFFYSTAISSIISIVLYAIFVYLLGAIGAAIVTLFAEVLILLLSLYFISCKTFVVFSQKADIYKSLISSLVLVPIYFVLCKFISGWLCIILFGVIGLLTYLLIQIILKNTNIGILTNTIKNIKNR